MTTLPKVVPRVPRWKLEIYNMRYSNAEAIGEDIHASRLEDYDPLRCGWIPLDDSKLTMFDIGVAWDIRQKPTGTFKLRAEDRWWLTIDMICKAQAAIYYVDYIPDITLTLPSRIVFYIDNTDIEDHYPRGTVSVYGLVSGDEVGSTETIAVDGPGIYVTENTYVTASLINVYMDEDGQGASCTMSVWAQRGAGCGIRECRLWCDTNSDGVYGLVFGGYIREKRTKLDNSYPIASYELMGYAEFCQTNEYIAGYRGMYRCSHFQKTGQYGSCDANSVNFRAGGSSCYVGDWDTAHPSGVLVTSIEHRCTSYAPDITQPLPNDGWTYDEFYAPTDEQYYEYYPPTFFRALMAACNMCNSIEEGKPSSRPWSLPMMVIGQLYTALDEAYNLINLQTIHINDGSRVILEDMEVVKVVVDGAYIIGVERGADNTLAMSHPVGASVKAPKVAYATVSGVESALAKAHQLQESNLKHTIMDTLESLAENATAEISTTEYVAWIDCFKQIQFTELDGACAGYDSAFVITADDIIKNPSYQLSPVINKISSQVDLSEDYWVYCEMSTDSPELTGYETSRQIFGTSSQEINNVNITAIVPTTDQVDFTTFATNFLKLTSFPRLTETITVDSFVPDEHYWMDVNVGDDSKKPYLDYTDEPNKHINLLGTTVTAPDFFKGKDENGDWYTSTFWVEGIKYESRVDGTREFLTTLAISRQTLPGEWY